MPLKILHKNASSGQKTSFPINYQDTSLLWERDRIVCKDDIIVTEEEILVTVSLIVNNEKVSGLLNGDFERFILLKYIRDSNKTSQRDVLNDVKQGKSTNSAYGKTMLTAGQFFNKDKFIINGNTYKSVCTDGLYIDAVTNYQIFLSQRMMNKRINDYLNSFKMYYKPSDGVQKANTELFDNLYITDIKETGYNLTANFYGVDNIYKSNKFWVLPLEFQENGVTYEIYSETEPPRIFTSYNDIINSAKQFSINSNAITINILGRDNVTFMSYKKLNSLYEEQTGDFNNFYQYILTIERGLDSEGQYLPGTVDLNDLSYTDVITISSNATGLNDDDVELYTTKFSISNNIADGLVGFYHELDNTKSNEENEGFYDNSAPVLEESIGQFLSSLTIVKWYTGILNDAIYKPEIKETAFNYVLNDSRSIDEFQGTDGKFRFIGDPGDENDPYPNKDIIGELNVQGFRFKNIQFSGTSNNGIFFVACNFEGATFEDCDFTNCIFEECNFKDVTSFNNIWTNYYDNLNTNITNEAPISDLGFGYRFVNGQFVGPDNALYGNTTNITFKTTASPGETGYEGTRENKFIPGTRGGGYGYDVSINGHNINNGIKSVIDLSNDEGITYNIRGICKVQPNVNLNMNLDQITIYGESSESVFKDTNYNKSDLISRRSTISDEAFSFQLFEDPLYEDINSWDDRINIGNSDSIADNEDFSTFFLNYVAGNPLFSGEDNRVEDPDFYKHQFQKDFTNPEAVKIIGFNNKIPFDHPHHGTWALARYPYNTFNDRDVILTYGEQHTRDTFYELSLNDLVPNDLDNHPDYYDPDGLDYYGNYAHKDPTNDEGNGIKPGWIQKNKGPLPYYRLDQRYTKNYFKHPTKGLMFGRFRLRKVNYNFQYIDKTSFPVREFGNIRYNNYVVTDSNTAIWDLSTNPEPNIDDTSYNKFRDFTYNFDSATVNTGY